jgi:hypothetical protein
MKNTILMMTLLMGLAVQAKTQPLSYMKQIVQDEIIRGTDGKDTKCEFRTKWLANGELVVTAVSKYKNMRPTTATVVFSKAKRAIVEIENGNDDFTEYRVEQSRVIKQEGDYKVHLLESLSFVFDASQLQYLVLNISEADFESDPHENVIRCEIPRPRP